MGLEPETRSLAAPVASGGTAFSIRETVALATHPKAFRPPGSRFLLSRFLYVIIRFIT
jgi:hypothetical protein